MLARFSRRRLALSAAILFTLILLALAITGDDEYLHVPANHFSSSRLWPLHNGKGRPAGGIVETPNGPRILDLWTNGHTILEQSHVDALEAEGGEDPKTLPNAIPKPSPSLRPHPTYDQIQSWIHGLRAEWSPPASETHCPPYNGYEDADYDPNLWEGFDFDYDFYIRNGIRKLRQEKPDDAKLVPYLPYPDYNSAAWKKEWKGNYVPCEGARGQLLNESKEDWIMAYSSLPDGFPEPVIGDAGLIGIDANRCFDRHHRLGPYGLDQNSKRGIADWAAPESKPKWTEVDWGNLQDQCLRSNQGRYSQSGRKSSNVDYSLPASNATRSLPIAHKRSRDSPKPHHRTALLIRTWPEYQYTANDLQVIRALITELSLLSGAEYQVFLFVHVKNNMVDLSDPVVRQVFLDMHVPREFHSISILWNEKILRQWYPEVGDWQVYWHQFMPLQWFSKMFPQFDFVWNWEMDARYTGHHYQFLEQISAFSKAAPRKYLWERNQRFYFPSAHGSYKEFLADTDATVETAMKEGEMQAVWGPLPYNETSQAPVGPKPPWPMESDDYDWGVGEEADLITLQPMWDPTHTSWVYKDKIFNFLPGIRPHFTPENPLDASFTHPEFENVPRRAYINTVSRFSKRQLHAMHLENQAGRTMQAEMWPATAALHHGLKAVYAPHPIWTDRKWPSWYLDAVFNSDGGKRAGWGGREDSVYNADREHNFAGWSWYYNADFPRVLYRRWLGWTASVGPKEQYPGEPLRVLGGSKFEEKGVKVKFPQLPRSLSREGRRVKVGGQGRICLPPMLLHPVKKVVEDDEQFEPEPSEEPDHTGLSRAWEWLLDDFQR